MDTNLGKELFSSVFDQMWGWVFTASGGRVAGTLIILGIFYKVIELLILGTINKLKKTKKQVRK